MVTIESLALTNKSPKKTLSYEAEYKAGVKKWEQHCPGVDEIVQSLTSKLHAEYPSGQRYPNARAFHWSEEQISYSISMLLKAVGKKPVLRVFSTAWIDNEAVLVRRSIAPYYVDLATPVRLAVLYGTINGLVEDIHTKSPALIQTGTEPGFKTGLVKIVETRLTPRP